MLQASPVFPQISFKDPSKKKCVKVRCMCIWSVFFAYVNLFLHHKIPWGIGLWKNPFIGWGNLFREVETLFWITSLMKDRSWSWIHIQMSPWLFLPNQALSWIPGFAFQEQKAMTGSIPECGSAMYSFPIAPVTLPKCSGLKQQEGVFLQFCRPEFWNHFHQAQVKVSWGLIPPGAPGRDRLLASFQLLEAVCIPRLVGPHHVDFWLTLLPSSWKDPVMSLDPPG